MSIYEEFENSVDLDTTDIQNVDEAEIEEGTVVIDATDPEAIFEAEAELYIESAEEEVEDSVGNDCWD